MTPRPLIQAVRHLADVLDRENDALRAMDFRRAATLLPAKTAAFADLTAAAEVAPGTPDTGLVAAVRRLDALASRNRDLLERAIAAQQRVIGIVVSAVAAVALEPSYRASGRQSCLTGPMTLSTRA